MTPSKSQEIHTVKKDIFSFLKDKKSFTKNEFMDFFSYDEKKSSDKIADLLLKGDIFQNVIHSHLLGLN